MEFTHIHHTSKDFLKSFYQFYSPVFILNTGRSGSALLQKVFGGFDDIKSYHEAPPNLFLQSNYAYHNQYKEEVLLKMFEASRVELMLEAKVGNMIYLETNQCLVFYINQLIKLFPCAKFIHLTRHPADFVRSAVRKGWHKNDSVWELGRIKMKDSESWNKLNQIQRLGWLWTATHTFIEQFKANFQRNCLTIRLEDIVHSYDEFIEMIDFIGSKEAISKEEYETLFRTKHNELYMAPNEPSNMFKLTEYPEFKDWDEESRDDLRVMTAELSKTYNYNLY